MVSRKKAAGKARKAAKAKAKEEEEEKARNDRQVNSNAMQEALLQEVQQLPCSHGFDLHLLEGLKLRRICFQFVTAFAEKFEEATRGGDITLSNCLTIARNATMDEFARVWNESITMQIVVKYFLCSGTQGSRVGHYDRARSRAVIARYLEQHIAVHLHQTQALYNWPKLLETYHADQHTLVKFFRRRIPCSCMDEKYEEVKCITKMGICYNKKCSLPNREVERSKTMYCSRCRCAVYCSRECQVAHWAQHKTLCDSKAEIIAEFEARKPKCK